MSTAWSPPAVDDPPSWSHRHRAKLTVAALLAGAALLFAALHSLPRPSAAPARRETLLVISVPRPSSTPPPHPIATPPPLQPEQKMIVQTPVENEPKPEPVPDEPPPAALGTALQGKGPADAFNLSGHRGPGGPGGGGNGKGGVHSRWGWYACQVQNRIQQAVRGNRATRSAALRVDVKIWVAATGPRHARRTRRPRRRRPRPRRRPARPGPHRSPAFRAAPRGHAHADRPPPHPCPPLGRRVGSR